MARPNIITKNNTIPIIIKIVVEFVLVFESGLELELEPGIEPELEPGLEPDLERGGEPPGTPETVRLCLQLMSSVL